MSFGCEYFASIYSYLYILFNGHFAIFNGLFETIILIKAIRPHRYHSLVDNSSEFEFSPFTALSNMSNPHRGYSLLSSTGR